MIGLLFMSRSEWKDCTGVQGYISKIEVWCQGCHLSGCVWLLETKFLCQNIVIKVSYSYHGVSWRLQELAWCVQYLHQHQETWGWCWWRAGSVGENVWCLNNKLKALESFLVFYFESDFKTEGNGKTFRKIGWKLLTGCQHGPGLTRRDGSTRLYWR